MHCPDNWYQSFFSGVVLDMWRNVVTPEMTAAEADVIPRYLQLDPGSRLLDVPCGNGRLAIELAARGYYTAGVDLAEESIEEGKHAAEARGVMVDLRQGDMRDLGEMGMFDGVFCWGNSFGYLEEDGNLGFLFAAATVLVPGGKLLLEFGTLAETILPGLQPRNWYQVGDVLMAISNGYDIQRGRLITEYTFVKDGNVETRVGAQQVYLFRELRGYLQTAGFDQVEAYSYDGKPLQLAGQQRAIVVARKAI